MQEPECLSWLEQVSLLQKRGMIINEADARTLQSISYYRIKEFAAPLAVFDNERQTINYQGVQFSDVLKRYYQDKNLRLCPYNWCKF